MAVFSYAVKYAVTAVCRSPLRTGDTEGRVELVLLGSDGLPIIQGSSIVGVLRSYLEQFYGAEEAAALFGAKRSGATGDRTSAVTVSDGVFEEGTQTQLRPRLRMNRRTGTGIDSQKFDVRSVATGSVFRFELLFQTPEKDVCGEERLEEALAALNSGLITLGAQRANGFGLVSLDVRQRRYDLSQKEDRVAWMEDADATERVTLKRMNPCAVTFTVTGRTNGVLIRSGQMETIGKKTSVATAMKDAGQYVLPGSTLKGCIRARAEMIAGYLDCPDVAAELFGPEGETEAVAGKLRIRECQMKEYEKRVVNRTCISRFTGGVMEKRLFSEEPVSGEVRIQADVFTTQQRSLGLLFYAMRDLAMGLYSIGSEGSIGRGILVNGQLTICAGEKHCTLAFPVGKTVCRGDTGFVEQWLRAVDGGEQE